MDYTLNWSDNSLKSPFTLPGTSINTTSTSLTLTGKGAPNWGEPLQENLLHLLENFASKGVPPIQATTGQLWFDADAKTWNYFDSGSWHPLVSSIGVYPRTFTANSSYSSDNRTIIAELGFSSAAVTLSTGSLPAGMTLVVGQVYSGRYVVYAVGRPTVPGNYQGTLKVNGIEKLWFNIDVAGPGVTPDVGEYTVYSRTIVRGITYANENPAALTISSTAAINSASVVGGVLPGGTTSAASGTSIFINGTPNVLGSFEGEYIINGSTSLRSTVQVIDKSYASSTPTVYPFVGSVDVYRTQTLTSAYLATEEELLQLQNGSYYVFSSVASGTIGLPAVLVSYIAHLNDSLGQFRVSKYKTERWNDAGTSLISTTAAGLFTARNSPGSTIELFNEVNGNLYPGFKFHYKLMVVYNTTERKYTFSQEYKLSVDGVSGVYAYSSVPTNPITIYGIVQYQSQNGISFSGSTPVMQQVSFS